MKTVNILDIPFTYTDQVTFISILDKQIRSQQKSFIITTNPVIVMEVNKDSYFMDIINKATHIVADRNGIFKVAKLLHTPLPGRATGYYDTMTGLLALANENKSSIYLLGAEKTTLQKAKKKINSDYPNVSILGSHDGYFDWDDNTICEQIIQPDLIFVALGAPRQEEWIAMHFSSFTRGLFIDVGGSFDVMAGTVKHASVFWQKLNLEWFYRLIKQPNRWRRMKALPRFAIQIIKRKVRGSAS